MEFRQQYLGKILLAEDDELVARQLVAVLAKQKIQVDWFTTFKPASEALRKSEYHLLIADIYLQSEKPEGLDLVCIAKDCGIPSVIITAALDLEVAKEGLNKGADRLLEKPIDAAELKKAIFDIWENPRGLISRRERFFSLHQLTEKEKELTRLLLKGLTNQEIADISGTTLATVKFYTNQIFSKFAVKNRSELFNVIFPT